MSLPQGEGSYRRSRKAFRNEADKSGMRSDAYHIAATNADECVANVLAFIKEAGRESAHHGAPLRGRVPSFRAFQTAG